MENITIIDIEEKENSYDMNFAMLFSTARQQRKIIVKCGAYKFLIKSLDEDLINEVDK